MWLPALVVGMDSDGHVCGNRLGTGRDDDNTVLKLVSTLVDEGIADVPELALFLAVFDLDIRERGQHLRVPIDDSGAAIELAVVEEVDECLAHGVARRRIEGEGGALPVAGSAHPSCLRGDPRAGHADPVPDTLFKCFASEVVAGHALARELPFDDALCRDPGVVQTRQPERRLTQHPVPADQRVLDGQCDRVAQVQHAGHIGRRHDHGERLRLALDRFRRTEPTVVLPEGVDRVLNLGGVVGAAQVAQVGQVEFSGGHS